MGPKGVLNMLETEDSNLLGLMGNLMGINGNLMGN
jgi:hypothetical protein